MRQMDITHERVLVERAQSGDEKAFAELVTDAHRRMWAVAISITGDAHDAEDAVQNALISAWKNIGKFRPEARFSTWIYRIASNAALQVVRARKAVPDEDAGVDEVDTASPVAEQVPATIVVREALNDLDQVFKEALVLREYAGLSLEEIAAHQGVGASTVKTRLHRARTKARENLTTAGVSL